MVITIRIDARRVIVFVLRKENSSQRLHNVFFRNGQWFFQPGGNRIEFQYQPRDIRNIRVTRKIFNRRHAAIRPRPTSRFHHPS